MSRLMRLLGRGAGLEAAVEPASLRLPLAASDSTGIAAAGVRQQARCLVTYVWRWNQRFNIAKRPQWASFRSCMENRMGMPGIIDNIGLRRQRGANRRWELTTFSFSSSQRLK